MLRIRPPPIQHLRASLHHLIRQAHALERRRTAQAARDARWHAPMTTETRLLHLDEREWERSVLTFLAALSGDSPPTSPRLLVNATHAAAPAA